MHGIKEQLVNKKEQSKIKIDLSKHLNSEEVRLHLGLSVSIDEKKMRVKRFMGEL